jgi:quercetin dioxygenase-like cupin family protein
VTPFHVFVDGSCWVRLGTLPPVQISTGDVIILPRGDQHVLASHPDLLRCRSTASMRTLRPSRSR